MKQLFLAVSLASAALLASGALQAQTQTLTLNGRSFTLPGNTPIEVDGVAHVLSDLQYIPNGMQLQWRETGGMSAPPVRGPDDKALGVVPALVFSYTLIGPVTSTAPLSVLGQPFTINGDTVRAGFSDTATLALGTQMVVAGLLDANGTLLATLVERRAAPGNTYLLSGHVQQLGAAPGSFQVGTQWVDSGAVVFPDCVGGHPLPGDYVSIRAAAVANFPPGSVLSAVSDGRCITPVPAGTATAVGFLQGLVTAVPQPDRFEIGALTVTLSPTTVFSMGTIDDLSAGVAVTVDGTYTDAQTFAADAVQFLGPVVRFRVPMTPADVVPGVSVRPLGVLVRTSSQLRDQDGILANGLAQSRQVEVRGYLDRNGAAYATRIRDRGAPDFNDARIRGPVSAIANPLLTVQGQTINTLGSTFTDEWGAPLTSAQFFATLVIDDLVDVGGAVYTPATHTLSGGPIVLVGRDPVVVNPPPVPPPLTLRVGTAGGYALPDALMSDGFE